VHSAGGTLMQHLKEHRLQVGLRPGDVFFYFTTCGWMMWNWLVSGLASGATLVLYDGSPFAGDGDRLLDAIDARASTCSAPARSTSPRWRRRASVPRKTHRLRSLRTILSTGSPLSHESFDYVYRDFKPMSACRVSPVARTSCPASSVVRRHCPSTAARYRRQGSGWQWRSGMSRASR
jgi:acetoacetyl-CoA synthetase